MGIVVTKVVGKTALAPELELGAVSLALGMVAIRREGRMEN